MSFMVRASRLPYGIPFSILQSPQGLRVLVPLRDRHPEPRRRSRSLRGGNYETADGSRSPQNASSPTQDAPTALRASAHAIPVPPVVVTSSSSSTCNPLTEGDARNAPFKLLNRSDRLRPTCGRVPRIRASNCRSSLLTVNASPNRSDWLKPRPLRRDQWIGTGTTLSNEGRGNRSSASFIRRDMDRASAVAR